VLLLNLAWCVCFMFLLEEGILKSAQWIMKWVQTTMTSLTFIYFFCFMGSISLIRVARFWSQPIFLWNVTSELAQTVIDLKDVNGDMTSNGKLINPLRLLH
jgi:hypothetical protein